MGDSLDGDTSGQPVHTVYVSAFYMDKYPVTKALWDQVVGWNGGYSYSSPYPGSGNGKAANHPVQGVNWYDVVKWCNARSQMEGRVPAYYTDAALTQVYTAGQFDPHVKWSAVGYRLPTEAEWEKAARGGASGHRFPWADMDTITHGRANYSSSSGYDYDTSPTRGYNPAFATNGFPYTSPVGFFAPNAYGLYDMAGNVWQWCGDWYGSYANASQSDPSGPASGAYRVRRGGSWVGDAGYSRSACRGNSLNPSLSWDLGFRSVLAPSP